MGGLVCCLAHALLLALAATATAVTGATCPRFNVPQMDSAQVALLQAPRGPREGAHAGPGSTDTPPESIGAAKASAGRRPSLGLALGKTVIHAESRVSAHRRLSPTAGVQARRLAQASEGERAGLALAVVRLAALQRDIEANQAAALAELSAAATAGRGIVLKDHPRVASDKAASCPGSINATREQLGALHTSAGSLASSVRAAGYKVQALGEATSAQLEAIHERESQRAKQLTNCARQRSHNTAMHTLLSAELLQLQQSAPAGVEDVVDEDSVALLEVSAVHHHVRKAKESARGVALCDSRAAAAAASLAAAALHGGSRNLKRPADCNAEREALRKAYSKAFVQLGHLVSHYSGLTNSTGCTDEVHREHEAYNKQIQAESRRLAWETAEQFRGLAVLRPRLKEAVAAEGRLRRRVSGLEHCAQLPATALDLDRTRAALEALSACPGLSSGRPDT